MATAIAQMGLDGRRDATCTCDVCTALAAQYESDPGLTWLYRKKLVIRGWAGKTTPTEKAYILAHAPWAQANLAKLAGQPQFGQKHAPEEALEAEMVSEDLGATRGHLSGAEPTVAAGVPMAVEMEPARQLAGPGRP